MLDTTPVARLIIFHEWITYGWALDLNDAVRLNAQLLRRARVIGNLDARTRWHLSEKRTVERRRRHLRETVLRAARSCAFCSGPDPVTVRFVVPLSEGGADRLGNLAPCCLGCATRMPSQGRMRDRLKLRNVASDLLGQGQVSWRVVDWQTA